MTLEILTSKIEANEIDTVIVVFPDPLGRLVGKRYTGENFLASVAKHGTHACNYLLAVNMEMDPQDGYNVANWEAGFGDFEMRPDLATLRIIPWQQGAAMVICDFTREDGSLVLEAPRSTLRRQLDALAKTNYTCAIASELEFFLYNTTYPDAWKSGYRNLTPCSEYRIDYHTMQPTRDEPFFRAVRNYMGDAGIPVESSKGEWGRGQHEINFVYGEPLAIADRHVIFKQGIKEIAAQQGRAITFMAKPDMNEPGSSCHIHISLWRDGKNAFWDDAKKAPSQLFQQFLGGLIKYSPELCLFYAPTINAYKRYQPGSWAPTRMAWSRDNRTVGFRVVGHGNSFRIENRMPGADANPYLAFSAMIAAGLAGIKEKLNAGDEYRGNAYIDPKLAALPSSLEQAANLFEKSKLAKTAFTEPVVQYHTHTARLEIQSFQNSITDWEKTRYFERI
jgi:glutamine synthetase